MPKESVATIGFDFGTSTTMIAQGRETVKLGHSRARDWMPSLVGYDDSGSIVAGDEVEARRLTAIRSIKKTITAKQQYVRADLPTGIKDVPADKLMVALLREATRLAGEAGVKLNDHDVLRLGCPAMWDGAQRRRLLDIAALAELPVTLESLVDEPVAAGIAWLSSAKISRPAPLRVVVFDMGGGTLDIAVLDVQGIRLQNVAVLAAISIPEAGDALDDTLAEDLESGLLVDVDSLKNPLSARAELRDAARQIKLQLTTEDETPLNLSSRYFDGKEIWYTREQLNTAFEAQMDRAELAVVTALRIAKLTEQAPGSAYDIARTPIDDMTGKVDVVVLSGGMSHIPYVRERLQTIFASGRTEVVSGYLTADSSARLIPKLESAVVVGLAQSDRYGQINMYRPAFDIILEWNGGQDSCTVYAAYTPLVEQWQIARGGTDLRYVRNGLDLMLPRKASGKLRVISHTGNKIRATLGNRSLDGFPVAISEQKFEFSIYPNGRIRLVDDAGSHEGHLDDWHTI